MEKRYNDELMPNNFEEIAKAYSQSLKNKGFVFIRLNEEDLHLLVGEILVVISKMKACLSQIKHKIDSSDLDQFLDETEGSLCLKFGNKKPHKFNCVENINNSFLCLVSLENLLVLKLMTLSVKSDDFELCNKIITGITTIFSENIPNEFFVLD